VFDFSFFYATRFADGVVAEPCMTGGLVPGTNEIKEAVLQLGHHTI
jgi:hypothetical protein